MILDWISIVSFVESSDVSDIQDIQDINNRMRNGDETNDIVEDFIYGSRYDKLRSKFKV